MVSTRANQYQSLDSIKLRSRIIVKIQKKPTKKRIQTRVKIMEQPVADISNINPVQGSDEDTFYQEFAKIFDDSKRAWRSNKRHIGNGCFVYK